MMKKIKNNITLLNVISNLLLQLITIISAFIIPKIILKTFGSEVNGLISSLTQLLNFVTLLEGGLSGIILANFYKPLYDKDNNKISSVLKTTQKIYKKISIIFAIYTLIIGIFYPLIIKTSFSYLYIFTLVLILSFSLFIQYNFSLSYKLLLYADKKVYIVSFSQIISTILNIILFYFSVKIYPNIHFLKMISAIVFLIQPLIFNYVVKKNYIIDKNASVNNELLKSRWDGFATNIAYFIHSNTDIAILTIFAPLKIISVYSIYCLVVSGLKQAVTAVSSGISPSIGQIYAKGDKDELEKKFAIYEYIIFVMSFFLFVVGGLLITPFVLLYTKDITDVNYNQVTFGILLIISEFFYCIREPYINLAYSANKFKDIRKSAYIEAGINIFLSIIFVIKFNIVGVAIGTIVAMLYRTIYHVYYLKNHIIYRNTIHFISKFIIFLLTSIVGILICIIIFPAKIYSVENFIMYGIIYSIIMGVLYLIISVTIYKDEFFNILKIKK